MALQIRYRDLFRRRDIALLALVGVANAASVAGLLLLLREFVRSLTGHSVLGIAPEFILFLLAAVGTSIYSLMSGKSIRIASPLTAGDTKFCTQCGTQNAASNLFCKQCGSKFS